jgi:hypothetical protein
MKTQLVLSYFIVCSVFWTCKSTMEKENPQKLIYATITDSTCRNIIKDYINCYPFDNKGVYIVNIKHIEDTVKLFIGIFFTEKDVNSILNKNPYYFFENINKRIVILDTQLEDFFIPQYIKYDRSYFR